MPSGILRIVGTPIGNLADLSPRAQQALETADVAVCEDTRRTGQLYHLLGLKPPRCISNHKDNERTRAPAIIEELRGGATAVLVSDGGMPGISDPGAVLVAAAHATGIRVEVIPGPCAVSAAVAGSGFEGAYVMAGFLPRKGKERKAWFTRFAEAPETLVVYESPFRVKETVADFIKAYGNRPACLARELTKMHEEFLGPNLETIAEELKKRHAVKGECVLVVKGF